MDTAYTFSVNENGTVNFTSADGVAQIMGDADTTSLPALQAFLDNYNQVYLAESATVAPAIGDDITVNQTYQADTATPTTAATMVATPGKSQVTPGA